MKNNVKRAVEIGVVDTVTTLKEVEEMLFKMASEAHVDMVTSKDVFEIYAKVLRSRIHLEVFSLEELEKLPEAEAEPETEISDQMLFNEYYRIFQKLHSPTF